MTEPDDLWLLDKHRLLCGDAQSEAGVFRRLLKDERAVMVFADPPYNVKIKNVVGRGARKHAEFAMASGEMSAAQFTSLGKPSAQPPGFLKKALCTSYAWTGAISISYWLRAARSMALFSIWSSGSRPTRDRAASIARSTN